MPPPPPGRHEGGRRGVTARPNVGARTDAAGLVDGAADVDVAAASLKAGRHRRPDGSGSGSVRSSQPISFNWPGVARAIGR